LIHILDIGARGELHPRWNKIADRLHVTAFDADRNAPIQKAAVGKFEVLEGALWREAAVVPFHLTRSPGCSSIFAPNPEYLRRFDDPGRFDVVEQRQVQARPLNSFGIRPHFIKLDTQGSELAILEGASDCLDSVIGIEIETELAPMYKEAPLFSEVDAFLRNHDFELHDLNRFFWRDLEDRRMRFVCAEALYFKRRDKIRERAIAETLMNCYALTLRQAVAHSYQWLSRYVRRQRLYDSDMQIGQ
jgi:FkbM family methyltransferase